MTITINLKKNVPVSFRLKGLDGEYDDKEALKLDEEQFYALIAAEYQRAGKPSPKSIQRHFQEALQKAGIRERDFANDKRTDARLVVFVPNQEPSLYQKKTEGCCTIL